MEEKIIGEIKNAITHRIISKYSRTYGIHYYNLYFTDKRIIGSYIGSKPDSMMITPLGIYITPIKREKGKKIDEVEIPEKLLKGETNNFSINYDDIEGAIIEKNQGFFVAGIKIKLKKKIRGMGNKLIIKLPSQTHIDGIKTLFLKILPTKTTIKSGQT